jgi:transposase
LKSDKVDALMLAKLLKADLLPTVWIPPETQRHIRELLTHRVRLVRQRTAVIIKNAMSTLPKRAIAWCACW